MSRDRWIQVLVGATLIALTVWIARHTYWAETTVTTPLVGEAARNRFYALAHLAGSLGVPASTIGSLHRLPADGIVLVDSLHDDLRHEPIEALQEWVQSGGRLIIGAETLTGSEALQDWSGIKLSQGEHAAGRPPQADRPPQAGKPRTGMQPDGGCKPRTVAIDGMPNGQSLILCNGLASGFTSDRIPSWALSDSSGIQALRVSIGRGELTVIGPAFMLGNRNLAKQDHAQIFVAAVGLRHGDRLEILSRTRAAPLPVLLWRLAAPAIVFLLAALALVVWRHLPRFGPPLRPLTLIRRSLAEQLRAQARFASRTQKLGSLRAAIRRGLDEAAQRQIAGYALMGPSQQAQALAASTGIDAALVDAALSSDAGGGLNEHRAAITLLEACRRILIGSNLTQRHRA